MRVTQQDAGEYGTLKLINGTYTVHGKVVYVDTPDVERGVVKVLPTGSTVTQQFLIEAMDFTIDRPKFRAGWYSDAEYPVDAGFAPVYVTGDGDAYIPVTSPEKMASSEMYVEMKEGFARLVALDTLTGNSQ